MPCKKMKNKNCILYYQTLKSLFPDVGYKEGKFLKDLKLQIQRFALTHPNCSYEELELTFGKAEEVVFDYIESVGTDTIHSMVQKNTFRKRCIIGIVGTIILFYFTYVLYLYNSYKAYTESLPCSVETIIYEGERTP